MFKKDTKFSPPYGDGTMIRKLAGLALLFSPPYGDGTSFNAKAKYTATVFAPLRGWYRVGRSLP